MKLTALASRPEVSDSLHSIFTSSVVPPTTRSKLLLHMPTPQWHASMANFMQCCAESGLSVCPQYEVQMSVQTRIQCHVASIEHAAGFCFPVLC